MTWLLLHVVLIQMIFQISLLEMYILAWLFHLTFVIIVRGPDRYISQEEHDEEYEEEAEVADVFDSDFDEDVSSKSLA